MIIRKYLAFISFFLISLNHCLISQIVLQGIVTDNGAEYLGDGAEPVVNALVELTDQANANRKFSDYTDSYGHYSIQISATAIDKFDTGNPDVFILSQNYPNPFNPSTVIAYELPRPATIRIDIHNVLGQKIKTLVDGCQSEKYGRVVWDATNDFGSSVPAGIYIYSLIADGIRINRKMLLIDGGLNGSNQSITNSRETVSRLSKEMSDKYQLRITGNDIETYEQQNLQITGNTELNTTVFRTVTDIDDNVYRTVKIGNQWWMAQNLKVTHYRNGSTIPNITGNSEWGNFIIGAYCDYNNDINNISTYGRLYNSYAVIDSRNIAPVGWHVPYNIEWQILFDYLGGDDIASGKMKETGMTHWQNPNTGATNESGFNALPGGYRRGTDGTFNDLGFKTTFWAASECGKSLASYWRLSQDRSSTSTICDDMSMIILKCIKNDREKCITL